MTDLLTALTERDLASWSRLGFRETWVTYWAHRDRWSYTERQGHPDDSNLVLPTGEVAAPLVLADGLLRVWVDTAEGWLWAALPKEPEQWLSGMAPDWVRDTYSSVNSRGIVFEPVLVRRPLAEGEALAILDHIMPPAAAYEGLPAEQANVLRLGGWYPRDVTVQHAHGLPLGEPRVWWQIEDLPDAEALARKSPARWKYEKWPLDRTRDDTTVGPPARHLGVLLDHGISPTAVTAHREQGRPLDLDTLRCSAQPVIPDDATRVRLVRAGGRPRFALTAQSARDRLAKQNPHVPHTLIDEVHVEAVPGLVPLHVDANRHFVVWSDGAVDSPAEVYDPEKGHIGGTWPSEQQRLLATRDLIIACTRAANWPALQQARVWEAWLDAVRTDTAGVEKRTTLAHGAERTLTLTQHTVVLPGDAVAQLWETQTLIARSPRRTDPVCAHTMHTSEQEARAALDAADDGLPPVMTIAELAPYLGTTVAALRKALRRERLRQYDPASIATEIPTAAAEPGWVGTVGAYADADKPGNPKAAHLYDPRTVRAWWQARPGHGPGRGHSNQAPTVRPAAKPS